MKARFKECRIQANMSQKEVAGALKVSVQAVSYWENGNRMPSHENCSALASLYNVSIDYLLGREETPVDPISEPRVMDVGSMTMDIAELQKIKSMLEEALENKQYALSVDPRIVNMYDRLMVMNEDQLKQADLAIRLIEEMGKK